MLVSCFQSVALDIMSKSPDRSESTCICALCALQISDPNECVCAGGQAFHLDCYGANRKLERQFQKQPDASAMRQWRKENPSEYRYKALELCMAQRDVEGKVQRARRGQQETEKVNQILAEVREFSLMTKRRRIFLLGHKAFLSWFQREEGMSLEEAQAKWVVDKHDKKVFKCSEYGELKVAVRGHTVLEHATGTEQSSGAHRNGNEPLDASAGSSAFDGFAGVQAFRDGMDGSPGGGPGGRSMFGLPQGQGSGRGRSRSPARHTEGGGHRGRSGNPGQLQRGRSSNTLAPPDSPSPARSVHSARSAHTRVSRSRSRGASSCGRDEEDGARTPTRQSVSHAAAAIEPPIDGDYKPRVFAEIVKDKKLVCDKITRMAEVLKEEVSAAAKLKEDLEDKSHIQDFDFDSLMADGPKIVESAMEAVKEARASKVVMFMLCLVQFCCAMQWCCCCHAVLCLVQFCCAWCSFVVLGAMVLLLRLPSGCRCVVREEEGAGSDRGKARSHPDLVACFDGGDDRAIEE